MIFPFLKNMCPIPPPGMLMVKNTGCPEMTKYPLVYQIYNKEPVSSTATGKATNISSRDMEHRDSIQTKGESYLQVKTDADP